LNSNKSEHERIIITSIPQQTAPAMSSLKFPSKLIEDQIESVDPESRMAIRVR